MIRKLLYFVRSLSYSIQNNCNIVFFDRKKVSSSGMQFSHLLFAGLFTLFSVNFVGAQAASSTWALTGNGNATTVTGNITANGIAANGVNAISYTASGATSSGWTTGNAMGSDYYEFVVTPNANTIFNVSGIRFDHSVSGSTWSLRAYYSTDGFATSTPLSNAFNSTTTIQNVNYNSVNVPVNGVSLTVRIYGWNSGNNSRSLSIRNFVISGTTCAKANAGIDQYSTNLSFPLAANSPTSGTGTWSIASGPNTSTSQFNNLSSPTATFTPNGSGTWLLNWTINGCGPSTDQVSISNCSGNLITNGDFSSGTSGWTAAVNTKGPVSSTSYPEVLSESVYFSNNNSDNTAELDYEASLGQTVTVIPGVNYKLSFLYARRPLAPSSVAVDIKIIEGGTTTATKHITTSDNTSTAQVDFLTFIPTSSSIVIEFYNSLSTTGQTLGSIIDNVVLLPVSQEVPIAVTIPKGKYKTLTACIGASVGLDVDNISGSGVTYSWSTPSSGTSLVAGTTTKNPSVTFTQTGMKEFKVLATNSSGCGNVYSSTFVYVIDLPTVYNVTGAGPYCSGGTGVLVGLDGSDAVSPTSNISYQLQRDGVDVAGAVVTGTGSAISFGPQTVAGTYTVVAKNTLVSTACSSNMNGNPTVSISTPPTVSITGSSNICVGSKTTLSSTGVGTWLSNNTAVASVNAIGEVTGIATGTATFTFTNTAAPNCSATTAAVTVSSSTIVFDSSGSYTIPAGVTNIQVECWGAGGGGGGASANPSAGGGGAGGSYVKNTSFTVTPNTAYTINVGAGGTVATNAAGGKGGSSWFGSTTTILAVGGNGGALGSPNGAGGAAVLTGNVGGTSTYSTVGGGAGGNGATRTAGSGSAGANGGAGATGTATNGKGADGTAPGGGGAGGRNVGGTASTGGVGGMGRVTITLPTPTATAGGSTTICQTGTALVSGANATNGTILWTHNGTGSLTNATTLTPTYAAASGDAGNAVVLTMTVSNGPCLVATAIYTVNVTALSTANAGGVLPAICQGGTSQAMGGSVGGGATSGVWTGGSGSWANANNPSTATYTASASESGSITLTLTTNAGSCGAVTVTKTITVNQLSTANAGGVLPAICQGGTSQAMGGSVGGGATSGVWTGGSGSWANANNPSTATYTASASESGSITLTLTTNAGSCGAVTVTKTITVNQLSTANAGGVLPAICQGVTSQAMGGSVGGGATSGVWTGGSGSWANANNPSTATYTASASESGSITLTLTTNAGSCGAVTVTKTITVNQLSTANAGGVLPAICQGGTSQAMGGSVGGGATSGVWTGGSGSWANANNPSTATYTASASESGSITLTLTTNAGSCGAVTVTKTITVNKLSTANAGGVLPAICQGGTSQAMGGSVGGGATSGVWTGGSGSWANANNPSTATYTASASESGSITLTLTTNAGSCGAVTVTKTITINQLSTANAGGVLPAICQGGTSQAMGGSVGGGATSGVWTGGSGSWANANNPSTATYTASASESGSITLTLTTNVGSCGAVTVTKTITVNQLSTANAGGVLPAICQGGTSQAMGGSVGGGATSGTWTGGAGTWTNSGDPANATYKASASESGSITLTLTTNAGSCGAVTTTKLITINALPGTPSPGTPTQPTCASPVGSVLLSNLPSSGTWTITQSGSAPGSYNGTGATYNVQNLAPGNYTFTVVGAANSCSSLASTNVTINVSSSKVWTGNANGNWNNPANWNPSGIPLPSDCVVIPDASTVLNVPSIQGTGIVADAFTLNVNDNASLTVDSKNTLKVVGSVTVASLGSLVFKDEASLVQTTNATNTGNITYYRNTEPVRRYDFTYWSTPITNTVTPYKLKDLSPGTLLDKYQSYNSTTSLWDIHLNGLKDMEPAVGYAVRAPQTFSITAPTVYPAVFTGTPNNGDYSVAIYGAKWSLIGNPYPSAIDAEKLIKINHDASPSVDIGSLYFWTHNSPPSGTPSAGGSYDYTSNDYAVFNLSGSTGTGPTPPPTGDIAACQSFFMLASAPGVVKFTNDMRVDGRNEQFFKTAKTNAIEKNRVWLNLTSNQGAFKQVLVGYIEGATNDWDVNYDAATNNGNTFIDFYSINQADKLIIQGRALPFADTDRVPLGYKTTVAGDFIISIDHADGFFNNQAVYLEDKTTGKVTDLKAGNYTFTTAIGTFTDRFTIAYIKKTLGTGDFENLENTVFVSIKDKTIKVNSSKETIKEVTIYDINGQLLYSKKKIDVNELQIPNLQSSNQVLLVKVTLDNDFTTTKKIIFQ